MTAIPSRPMPVPVWPRQSDEVFCITSPPGAPVRASGVGLFRTIAAPLVLLALSSLLFFHRLADRDLWSSHEARAAQDAQTILLDGQWALPQLFDGKVELQKPPLYYWAVAAIAFLKGGVVDGWSVRLPAALAGLGGVFLLYIFGVWQKRPLVGFFAALILATALHYTSLARIGRIDMPLTFAVAVVVVSFYLGNNAPDRDGGVGTWSWFLLMYLACALAVLLKGPIGLCLPIAVIGSHLLFEGRLPVPWRMGNCLRFMSFVGIWWGVPLVLALTLPWFLWANGRTDGELFNVFFWKHNIERGWGGGSLAEHPWWFYGPRLVVDLAPWSPLLFLGLGITYRRGWWRSDPLVRLGLVWLGAVLLLLSSASFKRADYLLPAFPGAALFLGAVTEQLFAEPRWRRYVAAGLAVIILLTTSTWYGYLHVIVPRQEPRLEFRRFAEEIRRRAPAPQLVLFFRAEAHALAFHVGRPIDTILEWENLDAWAGRPEMYYVVMPPETAEEWPGHLKSGRLAEVLRSADLSGGRHAHPLVLLRTHPEVQPNP